MKLCDPCAERRRLLRLAVERQEYMEAAKHAALGLKEMVLGHRKEDADGVRKPDQRMGEED